jgi:hypothetical protein
MARGRSKIRDDDSCGRIMALCNVEQISHLHVTRLVADMAADTRLMSSAVIE